MKIVKIPLTIILGVALLCGAGLYVLIYHWIKQTALTCSGKWEQGVGEWKGRSETVFAVIGEFRPWIMGDNQGDLHAESLDFPLSVYVSDMKRIGSDPMTIYEFRQYNDPTIVGGYRSAFKELTLKFMDGMVFYGTCERS
ncbi:hypothetical protein G6L08_22785 [Agrobacterium rhizogenes]|nr:hypothetical protein [Rhizobium rhizogenes]